MARKRAEVISTVYRSNANSMRDFTINVRGGQDPIAMLVDNFVNDSVPEEE